MKLIKLEAIEDLFAVKGGAGEKETQETIIVNCAVANSGYIVNSGYVVKEP